MCSTSSAFAIHKKPRLNCRHHRNTLSIHNFGSFELLSARYKHMSTLLRTTPFLRSISLAAASRRTFTVSTRSMAPKQEWMVILPDYAGQLAERNQVRA